MKVLFCTDGSKTSYNAIYNFSKWFNNFTVDILSVSDITYLPDSVFFDGNRYLSECKNSTNSIIEYTQKALTENNIKISGIIKLCGNATDSILETEKESYYDCIIMGSNGKKGLQKWLGSVSQEVASASATNIYISKSKQETRNILFPVTSSAFSDYVIKSAIKNINFENAKVHLLTVYEMPEFLFIGKADPNWVNDVERGLQKSELQNLMNVEKLFAKDNIKIENKKVLSGNPAEKILEYINLNNISLVVTGMKKQNTIFQMSSVSRRVLENTNSDMMIYKEG